MMRFAVRRHFYGVEGVLRGHWKQGVLGTAVTENESTRSDKSESNIQDRCGIISY